MKIAVKLLIILALLFTVFGQFISASAGGGTSNGHFKDLGTDAYFYSTDSSGCLVTQVLIFASQHYFQSPPGPGSAGPFVSLNIYQYDECTGTQILYATGGTTTDLNLQVDKKLRWATLSATVNVYEGVSQSFKDMYVDLTWTATGPRTHQGFHEHRKSPCHMMWRSSGIFRTAEVSGSVSDGITTFALENTLVAEIFSTKSGNLVIGCQ